MLSRLKDKILLKHQPQPLIFDDIENISNVDEYLSESDEDNNRDIKVSEIYNSYNKETFTKRNPTSDRALDVGKFNVFSSFTGVQLSTKRGHQNSEKNNRENVVRDDTENIHPNSFITMERKTSFNKLFVATVEEHKRETQTETTLNTQKYSLNCDTTRETRFVASGQSNNDIPYAKRAHIEIDSSVMSYQVYTTDEDEVEITEALFSKVRHNRLEYVEHALRQNYFNIGRTDANGNTVLHVCAQNNNRKITTLLLENVANNDTAVNLNAVNLKGLSALDYAEKYGFEKLASYLISKGALNGSQM